MPNQCKSLCTTIFNARNINHWFKYNLRYCSECEVSFDTDILIRCPCCNIKLRLTSKYSKNHHTRTFKYN